MGVDHEGVLILGGGIFFYKVLKFLFSFVYFWNNAFFYLICVQSLEGKDMKWKYERKIEFRKKKSFLWGKRKESNLAKKNETVGFMGMMMFETKGLAWGIHEDYIGK